MRDDPLSPANPRGHRGGDGGAVLIVVALLMVALLTIVGIVVDLGQLRADRRDDQKAADMAALAAGYYLAGHGSLGNSVSNPRGACEAALASIKANNPSFPSAASLPCASLPDDAGICVADSMSMQTLTSTGSSPYVLTIKYPVPASELVQSAFEGGVGVGDGDDQCSRLKVSVQSTRLTFLAGIIGVNSQTIDATAVVKGSLDVKTKDVAALLLLERSNCAVLYTSGQGKVIVEPSTGSGANNPGRIQIDSEGTGTCTSNTNQDGHVIYAAGSGNGRIEVQDTATKPGLIGLYSLTPGINGKGGAVVTTPTASNGLSTTPLASQISSRLAVDNRYNNPISNADRITALHARAWAAVTGAQPAGSTLVSGAGCAPSGTTQVLGTTVYVDCPEFVADTTSFPAATSVYFTGKITVANNKTLSLPVAERVYVRGCLSPANGTSANCGNNASSTSNASAINVTGTMLVNTSSFAACPSTQTSTSRITEIVTLGGPVVITGSVAHCATFLYSGRNASTYEAQQKTSGQPNCSEEQPCPQDGNSWVDEGYITTPPGGTLYWTAPNRTGDPPSATNPFEDIAFWGESSRPSSVKGTGSSKATGVFFLPNSNVTFLGQGDQQVPQNAQYIARSLNLSGQGTLRLRPNPDDAVQTPSPGGWSLIR